MTLLSRLRSHIADLGVSVIFADKAAPPVEFQALVQRVRARLTKKGVSADGLPLFGAHINPDLSYIAPDCFHCTTGFERGGYPCVTINTARLYRFETPKTLRWLFESCRLWYDEPELHGPLMRCDVQSDDPRMDQPVDAAIHVGSAWVHPSLRGNGLGKAMVALHRLEAFERLGDHLMFGTTVGTKTGGFTGTTTHHGTATVCMFAPGDPNGVPEIQHIRIWSRDAAVKAADAIAAHGIATPDKVNQSSR